MLLTGLVGMLPEWMADEPLKDRLFRAVLVEHLPDDADVSGNIVLVLLSLEEYGRLCTALEDNVMSFSRAMGLSYSFFWNSLTMQLRKVSMNLSALSLELNSICTASSLLTPNQCRNSETVCLWSYRRLSAPHHTATSSFHSSSCSVENRFSVFVIMHAPFKKL